MILKFWHVTFSSCKIMITPISAQKHHNQRTMDIKTKIVLGWTAFAGSHLVMSHPPIRQSLIDKMGEKPFLATYSAVSFATLTPLCYYYYKFNKQRGLVVNSPSILKPLPTIGTVLNTLAIVTYGQSMVKPSPSSMQVTDKNDSKQVTGLTRITRHGLFLSAALFGTGQFLRTGTLVDLLFWGGFPLFWLIGCAHQDYRLKQTMPKEYFEKTSLIPFKAILEGRNDIQAALHEMSLNALIVSLVVGFGIRYHVFRRVLAMVRK
jgi:uncharacterized membrane protein